VYIEERFIVESVYVNVTHENLYCLKRGLLGEVFM
jgi:hypothetical protein